MQAMNELKQWLAQTRGRQVELARFLEVRPPVVNAWLSNSKPLPVRHAALIESFTGGAVTRQHLFPNDWHRIWPELSEAGSKQPMPADPRKAAAESVGESA
jgi:DNA-binding transcriptional regulator YdaS (Cro superfamily)